MPTTGGGLKPCPGETRPKNLLRRFVGRAHTNGGVQLRPLLRRVLKTAFEKVLRRVLRRCLAVCFTRRKGSEKGSEKGS